MRWCPEDTSIKIPANGRLPLLGPRRKITTRLEPKPIQFRKPFINICEQGFEEDSSLDAAHPDSIPREAKLLGEADGLAPAVLEQFSDL